MSVIQVITKFKKEGINALESVPEKRYVTIIQKANEAYYNNSPLLTDNEFDIVKEYFEKKYPQIIYSWRRSCRTRYHSPTSIVKFTQTKKYSSSRRIYNIKNEIRRKIQNEVR